MRERFYDDGVIYWPGALTNESLQLAREAYQWSLDHPGPGAGDIPSKNPGTFYQDLANPEAFSVYETLIKHPDILAIIRKLFSSDHAWFMYEQVFKKYGGDTRRTPWHQDTPYLPVRGHNLAVLWISFDSLDEKRSLEFVRKSHRGILYDGSAFDPSDDTRGLYNDPAYPPLPDKSLGGKILISLPFRLNRATWWYFIQAPCMEVVLPIRTKPGGHSLSVFLVMMQW